MSYPKEAPIFRVLSKGGTYIPFGAVVEGVEVEPLSNNHSRPDYCGVRLLNEDVAKLALRELAKRYYEVYGYLGASIKWYELQPLTREARLWKRRIADGKK